MEIRRGDFGDPAVRRLLDLHLSGMHAHSPPGHVHALDLSGLDRPDIEFWTAWDASALLGMGAVKILSATQAELKSMRTDPAHLRRGVAAMLLDHLIGRARTHGCTRVSLETGSGAAFEPALALYRRRGFVNGPAFGGYAASPFNQFLHLDV